MKKLLILMSVAALAFACEKQSEDKGAAQAQQIKLQAELSAPQLSRASHGLDETLPAGDDEEISVYVRKTVNGVFEEELYTNVKHTVSADNKLLKSVGEDAMFYPYDEGSAVNIYGIYPETPGDDLDFEFRVATGQDGREAYTKSDLKIAALMDVPNNSNGDMLLTFKHALSKIEILMKDKSVTRAEVVGTILNADVTFPTEKDSDKAYSVQAKADPETDYITIQDGIITGGEEVFEAILIPQTIKAGEVFLSLTTTDNEVIKLKLAQDLVLLSEHKYRFEIDDARTILNVNHGQIMPWEENESEHEIDPFK